MSYSRDNQSGGGWWVRLIAIIVFIAILIGYAFQTLGLVSWLFPSDDLFMQVVTVFVCDGCCVLYSMADMFYRFRLRKSKNIVFGMWIVTFVSSTIATCIQMYLTSTHNIPHAINPLIVAVAYGLIIAAFVANILAITVVIRAEHLAGQPEHVYLDDVRPGAVQVKMESATEPVAVQRTATLTPSLPPLPQRAAAPTAKKKVVQVVDNTTISK